MKKQQISEELFLRLLEHPARRSSIAAATLTGNANCGYVIYALRAAGQNATIQTIADMCYLSYHQARAALNDLEAAGLIVKIPSVKKYIWKGDHPERTPLMYQLTDLGLKCAPRSEQPTTTQTTNIITTPAAPAPTPKKQKTGEQIAQEAGLIDRFGGLSLLDYKTKTAYLTDKERVLLTEYIESMED